MRLGRYFAGGCGEGGATARRRGGAGAGAADPAVVGAGGRRRRRLRRLGGRIDPAGVDAVVRLRGTLSSIWAPNRVRQRNAAWIWPPGQPNRS